MIWTRQETGGATGTSKSGQSSCEWRAEPYLGTGPYGDSEVNKKVGERPTPDHELYLVWCGDASSLAWLGPADFAENVTGAMADELVRRLTVTPSGVNVRPENRGVTGIPSMFWVEGYDPNALTATESAFGLTVTVTIQLVEVDWNFGDGSPVAQAGLGEAWPQRSSVRHNYRNASHGTPYQVTATLLFQPAYTVNGVAGPPLEPIQVPVTRDYVVGQIQAERTR